MDCFGISVIANKWYVIGSLENLRNLQKRDDGFWIEVYVVLSTWETRVSKSKGPQLRYQWRILFFTTNSVSPSEVEENHFTYFKRAFDFAQADTVIFVL